MNEQHYGLPLCEQVIPAIGVSASDAHRAINRRMGAIFPMNPHRRFQSRTSLEENCVRLAEYAERLELELRCTQDRRKREDEHSIRLGVRVVELEEEVRRLEDRLAWAQRKLGHKV